MTVIPKTTTWLFCANGLALILGLAITGKLLSDSDQPYTEFPDVSKSNPELHAHLPIENRSLLEIPLFQPGRKAIIAASNSNTQIENPISITPPVLVGVIQTKNERMVLLEDRENKTSGLVRQGENFGDWKIKAIENNSVVIGQTQDDNMTMSLNPEKLPTINLEKTFQ